LKPAQANSSQDPISKKPNTGASGVAQVVERLPNKYKAMSLNPSTAKKKKERKKETAKMVRKDLKKTGEV
jgi:hypothetical protein